MKRAGSLLNLVAATGAAWIVCGLVVFALVVLT